jgi:hypothetical protein
MNRLDGGQQDQRSELVRLASQQPKGVQDIACVAACERAYPLVDRLACPKSRLVSRYALEELWGRVLLGWPKGSFGEMVERLPEVSAWNVRKPAYYAMSGISLLAHTFRFLESSGDENLTYVITTLLDLVTEYDETVALVSGRISSREKEIVCQQRLYGLTHGWPHLDNQVKRLLRTESFDAALVFREPVDLFCSLL